MNSYNNFWTWFQEEAQELHILIKLEIDLDTIWEKLLFQLHSVKKGLDFDVIIDDEDIIEFTITTGWDENNIETVKELVKAAPSIPGWKFIALQQAMPIEEINVHREGYDFNADTLSFVVFGDDIIITHCLYDEADGDVLIMGVLEFLRYYLGELEYLQMGDIIPQGRNYDGGQRRSIENLKSYLGINP